MNIVDEKKCEPQGGTEIEYSTATSTHTVPLSSACSTALEMITPVKTCQTQGGAELTNDSKGTPTPVAPQS